MGRVEELYCANIERFPHETIDDETVLIDSANGRLFLFSGNGPALWQRFIAGGTIDGVVAESTARYGESAAAPTRQFLEQLVDVGVLRRGAPAPSAAGGVQDWPAEFAAPVIERYDDISDIISMDPIHEVDPAKGWPHRLDGTP